MDREKYIIGTERIGNKVVYTKICVFCGGRFTSNRIDAITCHTNCRQAHNRRVKQGKQPLTDYPVKAKNKKTN